MSRTRFFLPSADRRLGDRYELIECLGDGSHGWVWKAHRLSDNAIVALKIPKDQGSSNSELEEGSLLIDTAPHPISVALFYIDEIYGIRVSSIPDVQPATAGFALCPLGHPPDVYSLVWPSSDADLKVC